MRRRSIVLVPIGLLLVAAQGAWAEQAPKPATARPPATTTVAKPAGAKLPTAIDAAFKASYPNATIKNVSKEKEGGKDVYEVESLDRGLARDLVYRPDGTVVSMEEALKPADVPAPVLTAFKGRYPKATITKHERVTNGTVVQYELQVKGANVGEVVLTPDGKFVSPK